MPILNDANILSLDGPDAGVPSVTHWDDKTKGFGVRVMASGTRTWIVRYRVGIRLRQVSLGNVANLKEGKARSAAKDMIAGARVGKDALAEIQAKKGAAAKPSFTVKHLIDTYLERDVDDRLKPSSVRSIKYSLNTLAKPLHDSDPATLHRREVADRVAKIGKDISATTADLFARHMARLFNWAMRSGLAEHNPADKLPPQLHGDKSRDRVLTGPELGAIWNAVDPASDYGAIVRLLALTCQRREEVGGMPWSEVDLAAAEWTIAAERAKNGRAQVVPLSPPALAILKDRFDAIDPDDADTRKEEVPEFVFGRLDGPFSGYSKGKKTLDAALVGGKVKVGGWRLHDLRRTGVTGMADLGVQPHIIEAVVNHVSGHKAGVAGVYNRASYAREKRQALDLWANHLMTLAGGVASNVRPFRRKK